MSDTIVTAVTIGVIAVMTWLTRGLPYLLFSEKKKLPQTVTYLGTVLPASIMIILVIYCLRNVKITAYPYGLAEFVSVAVVVLMQLWKKNTLISILVGTACYMVLIRTLFMI